MGFEAVDIPFSVTTTKRNPIQDLFVPLLKESVKYEVAVGYFSSNWIRDAAEGIAEIAHKGGRVKWILSPELSRDDWLLLSTLNEENKSEVINSFASRKVNELIDQLKTNTREAIAWMIADGILKFRIAIPKNQLSGIFHAKIGIFTDDKNNKVAFSGSYNLTGAAETNWETIEVYSSLREYEKERIKLKQDEFDLMWGNADPNLEVFKTNDNSIKPFITITRNSKRPYKLPNDEISKRKIPKIPEYFLNTEGKLRDHQEEALKNWFKNNGQGIFNMATGSGKTVTALSGATKLANGVIKKSLTICIIVTVPYRHLAEQWKNEAESFEFIPILCYGDYQNWPSELGAALYDLKSGDTEIVFVITVNATYSGNKFQQFVNRIDTNFLLIADEMHNLGANKLKECLPNNAQFRMGLSATPIRKNDDIGSALLEDYFGKQIISYGIKDAILDKTLTEYFYYPVLVELTDDEMDEYRELSSKIGKLFALGKDEDDKSLKYLLLERARLIGGAQNKIVKLCEILISRPNSKFNLVYVGDSKKEDIRQVDSILEMIGTQVGMKARKFTSDEKLNTRAEILSDFSKGDIQTIVAIRCLDEGVDVPRTETAYILASTTNPRQFIQRRGRVLRKAKGKKYSYIYDFITVPPEQEKYNELIGSIDFSAERKLMKRELERVNEFVSASNNGGEALGVLQNIKKRFNLLDL